MNAKKFLIRVNKPKKELVNFINERVVNHKGIVGSGFTQFNLNTNEVVIGWRNFPEHPHFKWANWFDDLSEVTLSNEEIDELLSNAKQLKMTWTTFKERMPELDQPIWVYKPSSGIRALFKHNDDILPCKIKFIKEYKDGKYYFLEGYSYKRGNSDLISEEKIMPLKWIPIPSPLNKT